jgi:hypothetical protein
MLLCKVGARKPVLAVPRRAKPRTGSTRSEALPVSVVPKSE